MHKYTFIQYVMHKKNFLKIFNKIYKKYLHNYLLSMYNYAIEFKGEIINEKNIKKIIKNLQKILFMHNILNKCIFMHYFLLINKATISKL